MAHLLGRLRRPLHLLLLRPLPPPVPIPSKSLITSSLVRTYSGGGRVNLVLTDRGLPKFVTDEPEAPNTRKKWQTKKRLKEQRKREKQRRKEANRRDPRSIRPKGRKGKNKFPDAEARIKYKLDKAKIKETILLEKLKRYEVAEAEGPMVKPESLTGEERFYMKKMAQKGSNYVPVGRRGVFGGVILNMHLHWKKHETVKVVCKPCKPGQVHEYARDIARLSGGIPIQVIGGDTIIFYRGKNYVQPEVMSPIDTLSKKKALEKSKYEQSLETVRRFIAMSEKELEIYYRHIALYGDPNKRHSDLVYGDQEKVNCNLDLGKTMSLDEETSHSFSHTSTDLSEVDISDDDELNSTEIDSDDYLTEDEVIFEGEEPSESDVDSEQERKSSPTIDSGLVHRQD